MGLRDVITGGVRAWGDAWNDITSLGGHYENDVSKFFENEVVNKADLRGAQVEAVLSGLPYVGDFLKGIEGVTQYEDLYNNTGKVPRYPALQNGGAGALAHGVTDITRKIEGGTHDLAEFYSGDREINNVFDSVNGYTGSHPVHEPHKTVYMNYGGL